MEIKEAIGILKEETKDWNKNSLGKTGQAIIYLLDLVAKIQDVEMPIKRKLRDTSTSYVTDLGEMRDNAHRDGVMEGYNQCHDDFLAYHLKKMSEKELK